MATAWCPWRTAVRLVKRTEARARELRPPQREKGLGATQTPNPGHARQPLGLASRCHRTEYSMREIFRTTADPPQRGSPEPRGDGHKSVEGKHRQPCRRWSERPLRLRLQPQVAGFPTTSWITSFSAHL